MNFLKSIIGVSLPFEIGTLVYKKDKGKLRYQLYEGKYKGEDVSIFEYDRSMNNSYDLEDEIRRCKTLKFNKLVEFKLDYEYNNKTYIITQYCVPLCTIINEISLLPSYYKDMWFDWCCYDANVCVLIVFCEY